MAFPEQHYLLAFGGVQAATEEWSMGLRLSDAFTQLDQATEADALNDYMGVLSTWWASGISSSACSLTWGKLNRIGTDGKYVNDYTNFEELATPVQPSGGGTQAPQVALVVTLETGFTRGYAHRGRMFFPAPRYSLNAATRQMTSTDTDAAAAAAAALLSSINAAVAGLTLAVFSAVGAGAKRPITGVSVGSVYDTMRSRRAQLEEVRSVASVAAGP